MIKLEKASIEDLPKFIMMEQSEDNKTFIISTTESEHRSNMVNPSLLYLRVIDDTDLKGFIILSLDLDGSSIEFRRIVIADKGKGIGQAAIEAMESYCYTTFNISRIWLDVYSHNHRAQHIYEKLGYKKFNQTCKTDNDLFFYEKILQ